MDNLQLQFGNQALLNMADICELFKKPRLNITLWLAQKGIAYTKVGREPFVSMIDLATYLARCKHGQQSVMANVNADDMKRRRGFSQMAEKRQLAK